MKVPNNNPSRKSLTRNQKIIAIIIIVLGSLFLLNEFAWRSQQDRDAEEWAQDYCWKLRRIDPSTYPGTDSICQEYEQRN